LAFRGRDKEMPAQFTLNFVTITGDPAFDFFFSLVFVFGVLGFSVSLLIRLFLRS